MIDNKILEEYSSKLKIDKFTVLREYLQIVFLNHAYKSMQSEKLVFKGGTAIRLMYQSPRFSEDLDFNSKLKVKEVKSLISDSIESAKKTIPGLYFKELKVLQGYSAKIYFDTEISPMPLTIKLDFSFRDEESLDVLQKTIPTEFPVQSYSLIKVMSEAEIFAEKIRTVFQRSKGRDLYDIWYLLNKKVDVRPDFIKAKMELIDIYFDKDKFFDKIRKYKQSDLEKDLFKFLPNDQRDIVYELKNLIVNSDGMKNLDD